MTAPGFIVPPATGWWVKGNVVPFPPPAELEIAGSSPFVRIGPKVFPSTSSLALAGSVPVVRNAGKLLLPTAAALTLTGTAPTIRGGPSLRPAAASLTVTGGTPLVGPPRRDAVGFGGSNVNGFTTSLGFNFSHTTSGPDSGVLVAFTSINSGQTPASQTRTVTYGGINMTQVVSVNINSEAFVEIWGMLNPPGGSQTVQVIVSSGANTGRQLVGSCVSYNHARGPGATFTNTGSGTALTQTVNASAEVKIFQVFGALASQAGYNQAGLFHFQVPSNQADIMIGDADGAGTVNFTSTGSTSAAWAAAAVLIIP